MVDGNLKALLQTSQLLRDTFSTGGGA